jgi:hypothetical protein
MWNVFKFKLQIFYLHWAAVFREDSLFFGWTLDFPNVWILCLWHGSQIKTLAFSAILRWFLYSSSAFQLIPRIKIGIISLAECNSGTLKKYLFGGNTAIEMKNITTYDNNGNWRSVFWLRCVPVLYVVKIFLNSVVVLTPNGHFLGVPVLHSVSGMSNTVRSESRCALRLRYVDLVVSIEVAVEVCCCFTVFSR